MQRSICQRKVKIIIKEEGEREEAFTKLELLTILSILKNFEILFHLSKGCLTKESLKVGPSFFNGKLNMIIILTLYHGVGKLTLVFCFLYQRDCSKL